MNKNKDKEFENWKSWKDDLFERPEEEWRSWILQKGQFNREISININKIIDYFKKEKKKKSKCVLVYNHTNLVCDKSYDGSTPYCPRCGGEVIRKQK